MNRKQYSVISWFFLVLAFLFIGVLLFSQSIMPLSLYNLGVNSYDIYYQVRNAIFDVVIYLSFPLFILFQILAWLEPKKKV